MNVSSCSLSSAPTTSIAWISVGSRCSIFTSSSFGAGPRNVLLSRFSRHNPEKSGVGTPGVTPSINQIGPEIRGAAALDGRDPLPRRPLERPERFAFLQVFHDGCALSAFEQRFGERHVGTEGGER